MVSIVYPWQWNTTLTVQSPWGTVIRAAGNARNRTAGDQKRYAAGDYRGGQFAPENSTDTSVPNEARVAIAARKKYTAARVKLAKSLKQAGDPSTWSERTQAKIERQTKLAETFKRDAESTQGKAARRGIQINALGKWTNQEPDPRIMRQAAEVRAQLKQIEKKFSTKGAERLDAEHAYAKAMEDYAYWRNELKTNAETAKEIMDYDISDPNWWKADDVLPSIRESMEITQGRLDRATEQRHAARKALLESAAGTEETRDQVVRSLIYPKNGLKTESEIFEISPDKNSRGDPVEWARRGLNEFATMFDESTAPLDEYDEPVPIRVNIYPEGGRANFDPSSQGGRINLYQGDGEVTTLHEAGHWLEEHNDAVNHKVRQFLKKRIGDQEPRPLSEITGNKSYADHEIAVQDGFDQAYTGKIYGDLNRPGTPTEVLSMGIERMRTNPTYFAERDPEYFDFIYAIMHGG